MASVTYTYRAIDPQGGDVSGAVQATDEKDAYAKLAARGLSPYEFRARTDDFDLGKYFRTRNIAGKDLSRYLRQFSTLLTANVTIIEALSTMARSRAHPLLAERTKAMISELRAGKKLSESFEKNLPEFPAYVFRLADLGEATGSLAKALSDAADRMEYELAVEADVKSALTYPMFLFFFGGLIVVAMFTFVVPRFATLLGDQLSDAPAISRATIGFGLWMQQNAGLALAGAALAAAGIAALFRNKRFQEWLRLNLESLPVVGTLLTKTDLGGWCRTVGVALLNKAQLVDALLLGENGARSPRLKRGLEQVRKQVRAGRPLEEALGDAAPEFDDIVLDLIRTGRNAGALGDMLVFAAKMYEDDAKERTKRMTALAEPMAISGIAVIVGGIVISIVLAMTSLYTIDF